MRPPDPYTEAPAGGPGGAGAWTLSAAGIARVDRYDVGPSIVFVPSEEVLMLTADLPLPSARRRAQALPFAIEDLIAAPLASAHVALGGEVVPGRYLAGVVAHPVMERWTGMLSDAGLDRAMLVPDALTLPQPPTDSWAVDLRGDRAMVRCPDGIGFAVPASDLASIWMAAGRPPCIQFGAPLPEAIPSTPAPPGDRISSLPSLDLRQGIYARPRRTMPRVVNRMLVVAAGGLLAHGAIAIADAAALRRLADARAGETRALIAQAAPDAPIGDDLASSAADLIAPNTARSTMLPLLRRVAVALAPAGGGAALRSLSYDAAAASLKVEVEAADMPGLQRIEQALQAGGLVTESGAASATQGKAIGSYVVRSRP